MEKGDDVFLGDLKDGGDDTFKGESVMMDDLKDSPQDEVDKVGGLQWGDEASPAASEYADDEWRDKYWALGFYLNQVVMVICLVAGKLTQPDPYDAQYRAITGIRASTGIEREGWEMGTRQFDDSDYNPDKDWATHLMASLGVSILVAMITCFAFVKALQYFPLAVVYASIALQIVAWALMGVLYLMAGSTPGAIFYFGIAFLILVMMVYFRDRIPFAAQLLNTSAHLLQEYPATLLVSLVTIIPLTLYWVFYIYTYIYTYHFGWGMWVYLFFSFYWFNFTINNVVHCTSAGSFASWYFASQGEDESSTSVVKNAFVRATTTSFGSITFGSLIIALVETFKAVVGRCRCLLSVIESLLKYFNRYALTYVAIFGFDFMESARKVIDLFKRSGIEAIVNDDITWYVLRIVAFGTAVTSTIAAGVVANLLSEGDWLVILLSTIAAWLCSFIVSNIVVGTLDSAVVTLFVCFAERPNDLASHDRELYEAFHTKYHETCPGLFTSPA